MSEIREGYSPKIKDAPFPPDTPKVERRPDGTVVGCAKCTPGSPYFDEPSQPGMLYTGRHWGPFAGTPCSIHKP